MKLLGSLLASALLSLGVKTISPAPNFEPQFRGPTPPRQTRPRFGGTGTTLRRAEPKPLSKRDQHRLKVALSKPAQPVPKILALEDARLAKQARGRSARIKQRLGA